MVMNAAAIAYDYHTFSNDTLRALGLNDAGIAKAWFRVLHTRSTRRGNVAVTHTRCATADEANAALQAYRAAGFDATIEVWWDGNHTPVRTWARAPLTTLEKQAVKLGLGGFPVYVAK